MKHTTLIFLLFFSLLSCGKEDKKDTGAKKISKKINAILGRTIGTEYTDSTSVEKFLKTHPEFEMHRKKMHKFYRRRDYQLAWSKEGEIVPQAPMFINLVQNIHLHGLKSYKDNRLREKYNKTTEARKPHREEIAALRKELDMLLTASYFQYAKDIWRGTVSPGEQSIDWHIDRKKVKYGKTLDAILSNSKTDNPFQEAEPLHQEYHKLKDLLAAYKQIEEQGGWPEVKLLEKGNKLKKGNSGPEIILLKKRLQATDDYALPDTGKLFNDDLEKAVKAFQKRHGLEADGIVSDKTLKALNVPVQERIEQIVINMERWRWVPEKISPNYILVNIPEYKLHLIENNKQVWPMNVIVGRAATSTPIFNDEIEYIVINPSWNVPKSIADTEIIPSIQKDTSFLSRFEMEVLENNKPVDPLAIDWVNMDEDMKKRYSFRQKPGDKNALGKIKFLFPNEYDVYLHDTPTGHLFSQAERDFSHGCIRIEEPVKFAEYLLKDQKPWTREKIEKAIKGGKEQIIKLEKKIPVYIVYFTSWVDENGVPNFREDLYGHDKKLEMVFFER